MLKVQRAKAAGLVKVGAGRELDITKSLYCAIKTKRHYLKHIRETEYILPEPLFPPTFTPHLLLFQQN